MSRKPDLGDMAMPKAKAIVPFGETPPPASVEAVPAAKSLTIKLDGPLYATLREYCHRTERERGSRVTHQEVVVAALKPYQGIKT